MVNTHINLSSFTRESPSQEIYKIVYRKNCPTSVFRASYYLKISLQTCNTLDLPATKIFIYLFTFQIRFHGYHEKGYFPENWATKVKSKIIVY